MKLQAAALATTLVLPLAAVGAISANAASPTVAPKPAPRAAVVAHHTAAAPTKRVCLTTEKLCFTAPASWDVKRTINRYPDTRDRIEEVTMSSRWTKKIVDVTAGPSGIGGYCDPQEAPYQMTVLKTQRTSATDRYGARLYAVTAVVKTDRYAPSVFLTPDKALRTTGKKAMCVGFMSDFFRGHQQDLVWATSQINPTRSYATAAQARSVAMDPAHREAFNVLATARR